MLQNKSVVWVLIVMILFLSACSHKKRSNSLYIDRSFGYVWKNIRHPMVQKYEREYSRTVYVRQSLADGSRYLPYIKKVMLSQGLPVEFAYLPILESGFDPNADSGKAVGMWQFTRPTARYYGLKINRRIDQRYNWRKSTHAASRYLKRLYCRFHGNWELILSAYNAGETYVAKQTKRQKTHNFWRLKLYKETKRYVPRFIAILREAGKYDRSLKYS